MDVPLPLLHAHLHVLLRVHIHHIQSSSTPDGGADVIDGEGGRGDLQAETCLLPEQERRGEPVALQIADVEI